MWGSSLWEDTEKSKMTISLPGLLVVLGGLGVASSLRLPPAPRAPAPRCMATAGKGGGGGSGRGFGAPPPSAAPAAKAGASSKKKASAPAARKVAAADADDYARAEERGRRMLEDMRKSSGAPPPLAKKSSGLNLTPEELAPMDPAAGVMPEAVSNRMLSRVVPFAGVGVIGAMLVFAAFYFLRTQLDLDVPPMVVAYASGAMLLLSFAGITYGVMSTSLDEEADQSLLGTENLQRNLNIMRGVEAERIAQTKEDVELEQAERDGILMSPAAAARREQQQKQR